MPAQNGTAKYIFKGREYVATYEVSGYLLTMRCELGVLNAALGLYEPQKLARRLIMVLCQRDAAKRKKALPKPIAILVPATEDVGTLRAAISTRAAATHERDAALYP